MNIFIFPSDFEKIYNILADPQTNRGLEAQCPTGA